MVDSEQKSASQSGDEAAPPAEGRLSFRLVLRSWHIVSFALGLAVLVAGLVFWKGPSAVWHRRAALARFREVKELQRSGQVYQAAMGLRQLEPSLWRIPEKAGEAYFLMGLVSNELAERSGMLEGQVYRSAALPFLRAAAKHGVPSEDALALSDELGRSLFNAGAFAESVPVMEKALESRRRLQAAIFRRMTLAALAAPEPDSRRALVLLVEWEEIPALPDVADAITRVRRELESGDVDVARSELETMNWLPRDVDPYTFRVDLAADLDISLGHAGAAVEALQKERAKNNAERSSLLERLALARSRTEPPDWQSVLAAANERLAIAGLKAEEIEGARRQAAEALLALGQPVAARTALDLAGGKEVEQGVARYLVARSYFDQGQKYRGRLAEPGARPIGQPNAMAAWFEPEWLNRLAADANFLMALRYYGGVLADRDMEEQEYLGLSLLESGIARTELGQYALADEAYERLINGFPGTDFEVAGHFRRASAYAQARDSRMLEAFEEAAAADRKMGRASYRNEYLSLADLRGILRAAWRDSHDEGRYADAIGVARVYQGYAPAAVAEQMLADAAKALADETQRRAASERGDVARRMQGEAWDHYALAGDQYLAAARADRASEQYVDLLWLAALNFFDGHAIERADATLLEFIAAHGGGERDYAAHQYLARCRMARGRFEEAADILEQRLAEQPRSPNRFEARIELAECYMELAARIGPSAMSETERSRRADCLRRAGEVLGANVDGLGFDLEPTALAWQRSLFVAGRLLFEEGRYEEAIGRLREAVQRYPDSPRAIEARFRIAQAYLEWSRESERQARAEDTPRARMVLEQERNRRLRAGVDELRGLVATLTTWQEERPLAPDEESLLQSSFFQIGEAQVALEDWPRVIDAFTAAANRFQDRPECLAAYIHIANAYLRLGRAAEAGSTLRQARWVLNQLEETTFADSALSKDQWKSRLDSLVGDL